MLIDAETALQSPAALVTYGLIGVGSHARVVCLRRLQPFFQLLRQ